MGGVGGALKDCWVGRPNVLGGRVSAGGNYLSKQYTTHVLACAYKKVG